MAYNPPLPASRINGANSGDPASRIEGMPPNFGEPAVPHVMTFAGIYNTFARTYLMSDAAMRDSWDNARFMRNDPRVMECLEMRRRATALLDGQFISDDDKDQRATQLAEDLNAIIKKTPRWMQVREQLMDALWFGKAGVQSAVQWRKVYGATPATPGGHCAVLARTKPIHGDKLVFRYDDPELRTRKDGAYPDQLGIRVAMSYKQGQLIDGQFLVEATDMGLAYFLDEDRRRQVAVHRHMIEDAEFETPERAGRIHGVGIRDRIYWFWTISQQILGFIVDYIERSAFGFEIWYYNGANPEAKTKTEKAAKERLANGSNVILCPVDPDSPNLQRLVDRIEPGFGGVDAVMQILKEYFGWTIKRYILGQVLTSEAQSTGFGDGLAGVHLNTWLQIVKYDATNLQETITEELGRPLCLWNYPGLVDLIGAPVRYEITTEAPDVEGKMKAMRDAYDMNAKIPAAEVYDRCGIRKPAEDEEVLQKQPEGAGMPGMPGQPGADPSTFPSAGAGPIGPDGQPMPPDGQQEGDEQGEDLHPDEQEELDNLPPPEQFRRGGTVERYTRDVSGEARDEGGKWTEGGGPAEKYAAPFDPQKHPHKGQGPGGGQFTSGSGSTGGPQKAPQTEHADPHAQWAALHREHQAHALVHVPRAKVKADEAHRELSKHNKYLKAYKDAAERLRAQGRHDEANAHAHIAHRIERSINEKHRPAAEAAHRAHVEAADRMDEIGGKAIGLGLHLGKGPHELDPRWDHEAQRTADTDESLKELRRNVAKGLKPPKPPKAPRQPKQPKAKPSKPEDSRLLERGEGGGDDWGKDSGDLREAWADKGKEAPDWEKKAQEARDAIRAIDSHPTYQRVLAAKKNKNATASELDTLKRFNKQRSHLSRLVKKHEDKNVRAGLVDDYAGHAGVPKEHLMDMAQELVAPMASAVNARNAARRAASRTIGLTDKDLADLENMQLDHSAAKEKIGGELGAKVAAMDKYASAIAREHPELDLGDPDTGSDLVANLWDAIRGGDHPVPQADDEEWLKKAAIRIETLRQEQEAEKTRPKEPWETEDFQREGLVERFARIWSTTK